MANLSSSRSLHGFWLVPHSTSSRECWTAAGCTSHRNPKPASGTASLQLPRETFVFWSLSCTSSLVALRSCTAYLQERVCAGEVHGLGVRVSPRFSAPLRLPLGSRPAHHLAVYIPLHRYGDVTLHLEEGKMIGFGFLGEKAHQPHSIACGWHGRGETLSWDWAVYLFKFQR